MHIGSGTLPETFKKEVILCPEVEEVPAAEAREVVLEVPAADSEVLMVDSEARAVRPRRLAEAGDGAAVIAAAAAVCPAV